MRKLSILLGAALILGAVFMLGRSPRLSEVRIEAQTNNARQPVSSSPASAAAADEAAIRFVVDEIDNAVDAKDWQKARAFFAEDIDVDFTSLAGGQPARIKSGDLIGAWRTNLYADKKSHHQRSNHRVTVTGDRAEVFSKGYAFNLLEKGEVSGLWEVWGDYRHTLEKTADGWKVSSMSLKVTHARGDDRVRTFVPQK